MDKKIQTLKKVQNKVEKLVDSYNWNDYSSPNYEIPENISRSLTDSVKQSAKVLDVINHIYDDSVYNLYFKGKSESVMKDITQTELEEIFQLILNK
jgi:hypothetical protein